MPLCTKLKTLFAFMSDPATIVLSVTGCVTQSWLGLQDEAAAEQLAHSFARAGGHRTSRDRRRPPLRRADTPTPGKFESFASLPPGNVAREDSVLSNAGHVPQ